MWISPDPCRQHYSPYTYGSNDPINRFDPDGCSDIPKALNGLGTAAGGIGIMGTGAVVGGAGVATAGVGGAALVVGGVALGGIGVHTFMAGWMNFLNGLTDTKSNHTPTYQDASSALIGMLPPGAQDVVNTADFIMTGKGVLDGGILDMVDMTSTMLDLPKNMDTAPVSMREIAPSDATRQVPKR
jgi:hypothetical protein